MALFAVKGIEDPMTRLTSPIGNGGRGICTPAGTKLTGARALSLAAMARSLSARRSFILSSAA